MKKSVLVFGGPTGAGETTITKALVKKYSNLQKLVAATSRKMRPGEINEVDYYFMTKEEFESAIAAGEVIEHTYVKNRDTYYGSYKPDLDKKIQAGFTVIANVDIVGSRYFKKHYGATTIFIMPESIDSLRKRIKNRDMTISDEELANRIRNAENEIENEKSFYDHVVVNADGRLDQAIEQIEIILKNESYDLKAL